MTIENPLSIFSKVLRSTMNAIPLTKAVTLDFCYDHVNKESSAFNPDEKLHLHQDELQPIRIQETE